MAPHKFRPLPDLNTKDERNEIEVSIDAIVLSQDQHHITSKLHSGTIRHDKREATPEELTEEKRIKSERRRLSNLAVGSADVDGSYDEGLALTAEPKPTFSKPSDPGTTRNDH